jgi:hypothetical protein
MKNVYKSEETGEVTKCSELTRSCSDVSVDVWVSGPMKPLVHKEDEECGARRCERGSGLVLGADRSAGKHKRKELQFAKQSNSVSKINGKHISAFHTLFLGDINTGT